ncbi:SPOR domain-containing protein [Parapedobacter pyrenivorans]|uniref:SPOR domain-containing protein n=1 Tax=Parapedobacter pyrenivorans TaxID=1305674 RepID=UPI00333FB96B
MNLGLCIANLLRRHPAVEVPGIGVFRKTRVSAFYDEARSAFLPPANRIELTEEHTDVFPITGYLQAQQQVDGATASRILDGAVKEVMESISRNGQALLDGLGYLFLDGASLIFEPLKNDDFDWKPISAGPPATGEKVAIGEVENPLIEGGEPEAAVSTEEYSGRRRTTRWMIAAVLLMLLVGVGAIWYFQPALFDRTAIAGFFGRAEEQHHQPASQEPSVAEIPLVESKADSVATDTVRATASAIDSIPVERIPDAKIVTEKPSVTYEIIVGSFATMAQARKFVADMKAKGYDLQAIDSKMPGNRKKISWGSFATEEEAYRELARVQKNFEPGAWIAKVAHD